MADDSGKLPSLEDMLAQSEQVEQKLLAERRKLARQLITAQDDAGLVEVGVNGHGDVVEVAINTALAGEVELGELAEAMLHAANAAQQRAKSPHGQSGTGGPAHQIREDT